MNHRTRTLWLCGLLHGFTHLYMVALLPLYLPLQRGLRLTSVAQATLLVTVMMVAYFAPSYFIGMLADRMSRKQLLGAGLAVNAVGFIGLSFAPSYPAALACLVVAGLGGSFYHPAATALVAQLFPAKLGRALGLVGVGSALGFFLGPLYAGWRADHAGWRAPVLELGLAGLVAAGVFVLLAHDPPGQPPEAARSNDRRFPARPVWSCLLVVSLLFSLRDLAGTGMATLSSLFLQQARGFTLQGTGLALSAIYLASTISNPLFGHLSDRGRLRWTLVILSIAAILIAVFPRVPRAWAVLVLLVYGFFFLASYPTTEAAVMAAVPNNVRGRVFGLFITGSGLVGNWGHWLAGEWVRRLGSAAGQAGSYFSAYAILALLVLASLGALPCLSVLRQRGRSEVPSPT